MAEESPMIPAPTTTIRGDDEDIIWSLLHGLMGMKFSEERMYQRG